jgi:hypothetical protein
MLAAVLASVGPPSAGPGDALTARPSLRGIPAFRVVVEQLGPRVEKAAGLRREDLQAHVESRLARAGVSVSADAPALLYVNVAVACNGLTCAYTVALEVQQKVRLDGRPEAGPFVASTWSTGTTGIAGRRVEGLRDRVREQVDRFLEAYRGVNPP